MDRVVLTSLARLSRLRTLASRLRFDHRKAKAQRSAFYIDTWKQAAAECNATASVLPGDLVQVEREGCAAIFLYNTTPLDDPCTLKFAGDKLLVHERLQEFGLPTPAHAAFSIQQLDLAKAFLNQHPTCVVKPAAGTGAGQGVTSGVRTPAQLKKAAVYAAGFCGRLIIEEQVDGENYRLLFLDGELLDVVHRGAPTIVGDGSSTIRKLLREENEARLRAGYSIAQCLVKVDGDMRQTLAKRKLRLSSVPIAGQTVTLKTVINDNQAGDNESVMSSVAESVVNAARLAARATRVRLAGVDVLTRDVEQPLEGRGVILEVNTTPGLHFHYQNRTGPKRVAVPILEAALSDAQRKQCLATERLHVR